MALTLNPWEKSKISLPPLKDPIDPPELLKCPLIVRRARTLFHLS
jgi:hypothetical protein